ncbi:Deacetylase [Dissulfuribacter thermophilus]|uniref:Deacetylase n=1 Tax=Dissulfuribacter thermophilus TaxID=1156395 RepID=A0A1B9F3R5_9BACT|nr:histone deacetylase [Dissulfuribacter thermophilus]OCC14577.1 Deacetylase [Dissulfuribacter thermophilus]
MAKFDDIFLITHEKCLLHQTHIDHPESPERLKVILKRLKESILGPSLKIVKADKAKREYLKLVHSDEYLFRFEETCLSGKEFFGHPDNSVSYDTFEASLYAVGACLKGVDLIEAGEAKYVFCCVRPPGHHAEAEIPLGFCFLNNVAITARYWQSVYGREKIAIIDWDAHHGNGIEGVFLEDPTVLYISIHEHPTFSFPGTGYSEDRGEGQGRGATLNIPLPPGAGENEVMEILKEEVNIALESFNPQVIIIAAGFDGHEMDDMSGLSYPTRVYGNLGIAARLWADKYCGGRLLTILEGGYHLEALSASCERYLGGLALRAQ